MENLCAQFCITLPRKKQLSSEKQQELNWCFNLFFIKESQRLCLLAEAGGVGERNSYKIRSRAVMQPGLTISRHRAGWDLRLYTRWSERLREGGTANAALLE